MTAEPPPAHHNPPFCTLQRAGLLIIIGATILWLFLLTPVFSPGFLMNFDHPLHQGIIQCYLNSPGWSFTSTWCSYLQAGLAPFQSYPPLLYYLVIMLSPLFGVEIAYKLMIALAWIFFPSVISWILFRLNHPLAGSIAYTLLLLEHGVPDMTGPEFLIIGSSGFNRMVALGLFALSLYLADGFFSKPTRKALAVISIATAAFFLVHPPTLLLFAIAIPILLLFHLSSLKKHLLFILSYPFLALLLLGFFLFPFLINIPSNELRNLGQQGPSLTLSIESALWTSIPLILLVLGGFGILLSFLGRIKGVTAFSILSGSIVIAWLVWPLLTTIPFASFVPLSLTVAIARALFMIGTGFTLEHASCFAFPAFSHQPSLNRNLSMTLLAIALFTAGALAAREFLYTSERLHDVTTSSHPAFSPLLSALKSINSTSGRILAEETFGQTSFPVSMSSSWGIGPLFTPSDLHHPLLRFFSNPHGGTRNYKILNNPVYDLNQETLTAVLENLTISYIIAGSLPYKGSFNFLPVHASFGPLTVFFNNATSPSYFHINDGILNNTRYQQTRASASVTAFSNTTLQFKVRYWGNWQARIDGRKVAVTRSSLDFMEIIVSPGTHTITFTYTPRWWDYAGLLVSLAGAALTLGLLLSPNRTTPPPAKAVQHNQGSPIP